MLAEKIVDYFHTNYQAVSSNSDWFNLNCPFCGGKNKLAVNPHINQIKCWKCEYKQDIYRFIQDVEYVGYRQAFKILSSYQGMPVNEMSDTRPKKKWLSDIPNVFNSSSKFELPYGYKALDQNDSYLGQIACKYLENRGFEIDYLQSLGFGYVDERHNDYLLDYYGYIIIPFKKNGMYYYFNARNFLSSDKKLRYKNPSAESFGIGKSELLWNEDALHKDRIWVMEGVFSALTMGDDAIATMGKAVSKAQIDKIIRSKVKEVVICFDPNCHQESVELALALFPFKKLKILTLKDGDPNDLGLKVLKSLDSETDYVNSITQLYNFLL